MLIELWEYGEKKRIGNMLKERATFLSLYPSKVLGYFVRAMFNPLKNDLIMDVRRQKLIDILAAQMEGFSYTKEQLEAMNNNELFDAYTTWHGLIGWADKLKDVVESIYKVELK